VRPPRTHIYARHTHAHAYAHTHAHAHAHARTHTRARTHAHARAHTFTALQPLTRSTGAINPIVLAFQQVVLGERQAGDETVPAHPGQQSERASRNVLVGTPLHPPVPRPPSFKPHPAAPYSPPPRSFNHHPTAPSLTTPNHPHSLAHHSRLAIPRPPTTAATARHPLMPLPAAPLPLPATARSLLSRAGAGGRRGLLRVCIDRRGG
jgi:hypothetical protein